MSGEVFALKNPEFLPVFDGEKRFFGGRQGWFSDKFAQSGGCGVVAAANILAYLALSNEKYSALYPKKTLAKADFTEFMEELCAFVKIRNAFGQPLGVWGKGRFENGVLAYAKSRGISLSPVSIKGGRDTKIAAEFIKTALLNDRPVAVLIGFNKRLGSIKYEFPSGGGGVGSFKRHWATITEIRENGGEYELLVSSWGAAAKISLSDLLLGEALYSALVYFE